MALVPAECSVCGGIVKVDNEERLAICQYCGKPFVVEEAIQTFNNYYNNIYHITNNTSHNYGDGAVVNVYEDKSKDFVIEAGVLKEYKGAAVDVVIPDGVLEIGYRCFKDLKIKSVIISNSVVTIGEGAFNNCKNLSSITIPDSVTTIGRDAFCSTNLKTVIIPDGVTSISEAVFGWCTNLTSIIIPDNVISIGEDAFRGCTALASVSLGNNVLSIGVGAFGNCKSLKAITIPNNVTSIGNAAFYGCENLSTVLISNSATKLGIRAFGDYWVSKGLCLYCGGTLKEGFFSSKCTKCGKGKDY